jgi:23S rRNA (uracil1939-C5)-methyltransferase
MFKKKLHTLFIEKLVPGGFGLGRLDEGIVVLVRYVLPGEKVLVREIGRKKDYVSAELIQVLTPSADRIKPPCPIYGRCGGCDLQHAGPDAQIRLKKALLADSLQRAAGDIFSDPLLSVEDPLQAPQQFYYRQRIRIQVDKKGNYGFFRPGSHILEPVSHCLLARKGLNKVLHQMHASHPFGELAKHCTSFELLFNPQENNTVLLLHFLRKPRPADCLFSRCLAHGTIGLSAILMQVEGYGIYDPLKQTFLASAPIMSHNPAIKAIKPRFSLSWEAGSFCQVNLGQNNNMVKVVLEMIVSGPHNRILDLYCGYGNFSLPVAKLGSEVLGIDAQNAAIRSAHRNAIRNNIHNCRFEKKQVSAAVKSLFDAGETFETIILDPPRQGAPEIVSLLPELSADQIIYVSCNPATLARDLGALIPAGYHLCRLVPIDMFPQTHHLESVTLLKRSNL